LSKTSIFENSNLVFFHSLFQCKVIGCLDSFVKQIQESHSEELCQKKNLCGNFRAANAGDNALECQACEMIISTVEGWVENGNNVNVIEQNLDILCKYLPTNYDQVVILTV
jgi:hypothetical protein